MDEEIAALLAAQDGVVSYAQLRRLGARRHDVERMVRRRELALLGPRVYVDHTGPPSPRQRAWAAVLLAEPAALCGPSALAETAPDAPVQVAIDARRRVTAPSGVRIHRRRDLARLVQWNATPPRLRYEVAVLDLVDAAESDLDVVRALADAVGSRRTTASRLRGALADRPRLRRRAWVGRLLDDIEAGACSVLEHGFLSLVERPHGLPRGLRQVARRGRRGREYRDVEYAAGLTVELDGRLGHDSFAGGGRDADRDLDDQAEGRSVVRLRWHQVFGTPCRTAERLARILQRRGWAGTPRPCGPDCPVADRA
ncbi:hypothetical protein GCM10027062_41020 [Nocardioides hungaricus]